MSNNLQIFLLQKYRINYLLHDDNLNSHLIVEPKHFGKGERKKKAAVNSKLFESNISHTKLKINLHIQFSDKKLMLKLVFQ